MTTQTDSKTKASQHDSYTLFTLIAILLPLVGVILGIIYLTKDSRLDKKLGEHALALGVLFSFIVWPITGWLLLGNLSTQAENTVVPSSYDSSLSTTQTSNWDYQAAYDKIETGMTKSQVEDVTDRTGIDCSETKVSGYKTESCTYGNSNDPGFIIVQYDNDLVTSKAKQAL